LDLNETIIDVDDDKSFNILKFGAPAVAEVDDSILINDSGSGVNIEGVLFLMRKDGISRLKKMFKVILRIHIYFEYSFNF
jgi:hypothetical protein